MSDDHDLLIRMSEKLDQIHGEIVGTEVNPGLKLRVDHLEAWRDESKGWLAALRWVWAAIGAVLGLLGWHMHAGK